MTALVGRLARKSVLAHRTTGPAPGVVPLAALARAAGARVGHDVRVMDAVVSARLGGASWREVGLALGVTAQAAHKRFGAAAARRVADAGGAVPIQRRSPVDRAELLHLLECAESICVTADRLGTTPRAAEKAVQRRMKHERALGCVTTDTHRLAVLVAREMVRLRSVVAP